MAGSTQPRHRREDIADKIVAQRTLFADVVFAHFDRVGWWNDVKLPWRRLSGMVSKSDQNLERWLAGAMPSPEHIDALSDILHIPARTIDHILRHNSWPPDDPDPLTGAKAKLCQVIPRLSDKQAGILLDTAEEFLARVRDVKDDL